MARYNNYNQANIRKNQLKQEKYELEVKRQDYESMISSLKSISSELKGAYDSLNNAFVSYQAAYVTNGGDKANRKDFQNELSNIKHIYHSSINSYLLPGAENELESIKRQIISKEREISDIYFYNNNKRRYEKI